MTQRDFFKDLNDSMKGFGLGLAYGDKVELDGSTIIPVAIAGFGAGQGSGEGHVDGGQGGDAEEQSTAGGTAKSLADAARRGQGEGAGAGGGVFPVGAYVSDEFGTRFQPNIVALLIAAAPIALATAWGLPRIIKAIKR